MKKILLTTTALAFAGSAFAATVSGKITSQYQKEGAEKTLKTKGEVLFSGSKTSSNGLTFGGTYKVLVDNGQTTDANYTSAKLNASRSDVSGKSTNPDTDGNSVSKVLNGNSLDEGSFDKGEQTESQVSAFVTGSFGRVDMGRHSTAARALGGKAFGLQTADDRTVRGITYTSPTFSGFRAAYTWSANAGDEKSIGIGYSGNFSGIDVKVGWGNVKKNDTAGAAKTETGLGLSVGMSGFTLEYAQGTDGDKNKFNSVGGKYEAAGFLVSYYRKNSPITADTKNKNTYLTAEYTVAEGLKVFMKNNEEEKVKKTYIGTTINF